MKLQTIINGPKAGSRRQIKRLLRAANSNICQKIGLRPATGLKHGPFDAPEPEDRIYSPANTLLAALLIIYPVVASVAVALAGMWFLGSTGPI